MLVNSKFWSAWKSISNFWSQDSLSLFPSYEFLLILKHDIALCVLTLNFSSPHFIIEKNWNLARRSFWRDFFSRSTKAGFSTAASNVLKSYRCHNFYCQVFSEPEIFEAFYQQFEFSALSLHAKITFRSLLNVSRLPSGVA